MPVYAILLAGGRGRRVGGADKGLLQYHSDTLLKQVLNRLEPQVDQIVISANRNLDHYKRYTFPVVTDAEPDYPGPLSGICSALRYINQHLPPADWVLLAPCDAPNYPKNLRDYLIDSLVQTAGYHSAQQWQCLLPHDGVRYQPLFSMLQPTVLPQLEAQLNLAHYQVVSALRQLNTLEVAASQLASGFTNINYLDQLPGHGSD